MQAPNKQAFRLTIADNLFQRDYPELALGYLERTQGLDRPSIDENLLRSLCLYQGLGRFSAAMSLLASANELGASQARSLGLGDCHLRVLDPAWARHIGDTAMLDYVIKLGILEGRNRIDTVLYLPRGSPVANNFLMRQLAAHFRLIEDPGDLPFDASALQALHFDMIGPRLPDETTAYYWELEAKTYERWQEAGRGPLLKLTPDVVVQGRRVLKRLGVPEDAWFVALHVREGRRGGPNGLHTTRNARVETYLPALAEIASRGGWVVRMGDPAMGPLPPLPNLVDYCHSTARSDWMDVFIAACCRFMIGTISGPNFVPALYGRPAVLTNWWPPAQRPFHASDIFIPKLLRRMSDRRYLTLTETLSEPFSYCHSRRHLAVRGVQVEDNDPDLIGAAVVEMLARLDEDSNHSPEVADLRARSNCIYRVHGKGGMSALAAAFILRHRDLIA